MKIDTDKMIENVRNAREAALQRGDATSYNDLDKLLKSLIAKPL